MQPRSSLTHLLTFQMLMKLVIDRFTACNITSFQSFFFNILLNTILAIKDVNILCLQNCVVTPMGIITDIQTLLLAVMCHVAINCLCKRSSADESEQKQEFCFVDAGIAFCKLQHLIPTVPVKTQVSLTHPSRKADFGYDLVS